MVKFLCEICDKLYSTKENYNNHLYTNKHILNAELEKDKKKIKKDKKRIKKDKKIKKNMK
jgi:hypothetical protein